MLTTTSHLKSISFVALFTPGCWVITTCIYETFGLVYSDGLTPALAPVYDFVSVAPYPEYFHSNYLALPLLTREEGGRELAPGFHSDYGEYIGQDFLLLGESMGLAPRLLEKLFQDIRKENAIVMETYEQSFMTQDHIQAVLQCYRHRLGAAVSSPRYFYSISFNSGEKAQQNAIKQDKPCF